MVQKKMILLAKKHKTWINIVLSFGCSKTIAEDIVQEMYIKILLKLENGLDIMYEDEINYYYIFKVLKTLYIDLKRKGKNIKIINIEDTNLSQYDFDVDYVKGKNQTTGEPLPSIIIVEKTSRVPLLIVRVKREAVGGGYYRNLIEKGKFMGEVIAENA